MKRITVLYAKESYLSSIGKDLTTFSFLMLCIWFANDQGGGWWTFFTTCLFLVFVSAKIAIASGESIKIRSKSEAVKWANQLANDDENE